MKLFKVVSLVIIFWLLVGLMCGIFEVPFKPYGDYWFYTALVLVFLLNFSLFRMIFFNKK